MNSIRFLSAVVTATAAFLAAIPVAAQVNTVREIAPGVFFHEGDSRLGHCNNGWVVFEDHVFVVDANYPGGAQVIMPKIREITDRPVRLVFDTHHHADHAYGNRLWAEAGALIVATVGAAEQLQLIEPEAWNGRALVRPDMKATSLKHPSIMFGENLFFDDGKQRVELHRFGVGHTQGDGYAWLPREKILFTGDACVNGAFNNVRDGDVGAWIKTLEVVKQLGAAIVCPGHGPIGGPELLVDQQQFFVELTRRVQALRAATKSAAEAKAAVPTIAAELKAIPNIARYVGGGLEGQAEKVWTELGGGSFPK